MHSLQNTHRLSEISTQAARLRTRIERSQILCAILAGQIRRATCGLEALEKSIQAAETETGMQGASAQAA